MSESQPTAKWSVPHEPCSIPYEPLETYEQVIDYLYGRINYERARAESYGPHDFKLDRMHLLLELLGHPEYQIPALHVAGTKGKGTVCTLLATALSAHGYRTGLYTSPHLVRFEERIRVDGQSPTPEELVALVNQVRAVVIRMDQRPARYHPTYFEIATALAWLDFQRRGVQWAVLETGLGGRLDSTNLCRPRVTVITNVSRDHMHILGDTVAEIAREKAGIIKPNIPLICGAEHPDAQRVIHNQAQTLQAPVWQWGRDIHAELVPPTTRDDVDPQHDCRYLSVSSPLGTWSCLPVVLPGDHQLVNAALAAATLQRLSLEGVPIKPEAVRQAWQTVHWPGRIEVLAHRPTVIIDAAHNWASTRALLQTLSQRCTHHARRYLIFATSRDKDYRGILRQLVPWFDTLIFTRFLENPRALPAEDLQEFVLASCRRPAHLAADPYTAWKMARRLVTTDDLIVITGSFFLIGELRDLILEESKECPPSTTMNMYVP
ncbi:MAG: bifunctional folylpolyglutamate synthase/dihydrofolate synthase [Planctomycetaceae bacterium]|nr:MAG: bifunctional folylpolyglutamate synthase/dihydrofolate synthase [Planctomycetaceae bacterium]